MVVATPNINSLLNVEDTHSQFIQFSVLRFHFEDDDNVVENQHLRLVIRNLWRGSVPDKAGTDSDCFQVDIRTRT